MSMSSASDSEASYIEEPVEIIKKRKHESVAAHSKSKKLESKSKKSKKVKSIKSNSDTEEEYKSNNEGSDSDMGEIEEEVVPIKKKKIQKVSSVKKSKEDIIPIINFKSIKNEKAKFIGGSETSFPIAKKALLLYKIFVKGKESIDFTKRVENFTNSIVYLMMEENNHLFSSEEMNENKILFDDAVYEGLKYEINIEGMFKGPFVNCLSKKNLEEVDGFSANSSVDKDGKPKHVLSGIIFVFDTISWQKGGSGKHTFDILKIDSGNTISSRITSLLTEDSKITSFLKIGQPTKVVDAFDKKLTYQGIVVMSLDSITATQKYIHIKTYFKDILRVEKDEVQDLTIDIKTTIDAQIEKDEDNSAMEKKVTMLKMLLEKINEM